MQVDNLIKMANQIGTFYETEPDVETGIAGIANHINRFWDPRMRRAFVEHVAARGSEELLPIVAEATCRIAVRQEKPIAS